MLFGLPGIALWAIQMAWIPFWAAGVVNGLGHWWGYRNYETTDDSRNLWWVGLLAFGEGWHNYHHAFPYDFRCSDKWYQWNPTKWVIQTLSTVGVTWNLRMRRPNERAE